jgi:hypothetical protein
LSDYILLPNGDTVRGDELYHWKYIKREKVNGKWRYTYEEPNSVIDSNRLFNKKYTTKDFDGNKRNVLVRGKLSRTVDQGKNELKKYVAGQKRDWKESSNVKEYLKDRLGFDEKAAYEKASAEANNASAKASLEARNYARVKQTKDEYQGIINKKKYREETETARVRAARASRRAGMYQAEAKTALAAYASTPLAKIEKAAHAGEEWYKRLRKRNKSAADPTVILKDKSVSQR